MHSRRLQESLKRPQEPVQRVEDLPRSQMMKLQKLLYSRINKHGLFCGVSQLEEPERQFQLASTRKRSLLIKTKKLLVEAAVAANAVHKSAARSAAEEQGVLDRKQNLYIVKL